jgi:hypothetical protein
MLRFLGAIVVIALLVGAFGYGRGWFTVNPSTEGGRTQVTFGLDRKKVEDDLRIAREKIDEQQRSIDQKMLQLRERAARATTALRGDVDRTIEDLERRRVEVGRKIEEMKTASGERLDELKGEIKADLERIEESIDAALERYP